jgi:hypothetical protein
MPMIAAIQSNPLPSGLGTSTTTGCATPWPPTGPRASGLRWSSASRITGSDVPTAFSPRRSEPAAGGATAWLRRRGGVLAAEVVAGRHRERRRGAGDRRGEGDGERAAGVAEHGPLLLVSGRPMRPAAGTVL